MEDDLRKLGIKRWRIKALDKDGGHQLQSKPRPNCKPIVP
jgi:hypothetical protein